MQRIDLNSPELYLNRHLSHLQFNIRVLEQALDGRQPLLEQLKFLLIFSHNLDEFFEIRVAGLRRQIQFSKESVDADGLHPQEVLKQISMICHEIVDKQYDVLNNLLIPALAAENINFIKRSDWTPKQATWIKRYFQHQVLPVISPIGLDPAHPFPRLVNKSLNFIVSLEGKDAFGRDSGLAIVPAPRSLPRLIRLPNDICEQGDNFVFLSSMIHTHLDELFPGMTSTGCYQFRITRNADVEILEEEVKDLARALRGELLLRPYGDAVRIEVAENCPDELSQFLLTQFGLDQDALYRVNGPVNLGRLMALNDLIDRPDLYFPPFTPGMPKNLADNACVFSVMKQTDTLLFHPFQSFTPVVDLLQQAAKDPDVLSIRQTLYRTGADSEIVNALVEAARNRKEVTAVIEIRARFDEEDNLALASRLQEAGAVVVYGVVGYKTHSKMLLIVRREDNRLNMYAHLGTGNYHPKNARLYTDYSLLTCDEAICNDVHKLFQQLTGMGKTSRFKKLLYAPFTLQKGIIDLISREEKLVENGKSGHIIIKVNALTDHKLIKALYKASQAGVKIDLIIRGMCCLRPQVSGLSENIHVRSIVGRFLEHSRVYYFANEQHPNVFCSSADWMERNTKRRIEVCFPIQEPKLAQRIKRDLDYYLSDNCQSWELQPDGSYIQNQPAGNAKEKTAQHLLLSTYAS